MIREDRSSRVERRAPPHICFKDAKEPRPASAREDAKYAFSRVLCDGEGSERA